MDKAFFHMPGSVWLAGPFPYGQASRHPAFRLTKLFRYRFVH